MASPDVATISRPKLLPTGIIRKLALPLLRRVRTSPADRLCEIVAYTAGDQSLFEASEYPEFLGSIYKRVDQMEDSGVHLLVKKYLSDC